jgi:hypothetical protein
MNKCVVIGLMLLVGTVMASVVLFLALLIYEFANGYAIALKDSLAAIPHLFVMALVLVVALWALEMLKGTRT